MGLDSSQSAELIVRLRELNQMKISRAESVMSSLECQLFRAIPLLLHCNNVYWPGYVGSACAHGIAGYQADDELVQMLANLLGRPLLADESFASSRSDILGVYCMGSTSSLGQCPDSDLDVWVIHGNDVAVSDLLLLEQKCSRITDWAQRIGVELHFFCVTPDQFQSSRQQTMSDENCGSSQNWLLLDEFYRSAVRLAGLPMSWALVPTEHEDHAAIYLAQLEQQGVIDRSQWLDLGQIPRVPAEEYFGAALWQLYKGIDSPYKAVLKILLLEAYAYDFPNTELLCQQAKREWQYSDIDPLAFDSYFLSLQRVSRYLQEIGDDERLDLVRRCFYLKTRIRLSQQNDIHDWRTLTLKRLVQQWQWDDAKIQYLDQRDQWKVEHVKVAYQETLSALMQSFRRLIEFARERHVSEAINPEDIGVLSRKLYAAFEQTPSKLTLINPGIVPTLHEPQVSLIESRHANHVEPGWYFYKHAMLPQQLLGTVAQYHTEQLFKMVCWCYFNGIISVNSQLYLHTVESGIDRPTLQQLVQDLADYFPIQLPPTSKEAMTKPSDIRKLGLFINLERDDSAHVLPLDDMAQADVLSFGEQQSNLVSSVDVLYLTSWNELHTLHFTGQEAVLDAIVTLASKLHRQSALPTSIRVCSYAERYSELIRSQLLSLVRSCLELRLKPDANGQSYRMVQIGGERFGLFFERRGVHKQRLANPVDFYNHISLSKVGGADSLAVTSDAAMPEIVENHASEGLVQFFFEREGASFNIYVVDERNRVEAYRQFNGSKDELVHSVNRFYSSSQQRLKVGAQQFNFNLPQFYEIIEKNGRKVIVPYRSSTVYPTATTRSA